MSYYSDVLNKARMNKGLSKEEVLLKVEVALKRTPQLKYEVDVEPLGEILEGEKIPTVLEASILADATGIEFSSLFDLNNKPGRKK